MLPVDICISSFRPLAIIFSAPLTENTANLRRKIRVQFDCTNCLIELYVSSQTLDQVVVIMFIFGSYTEKMPKRGKTFLIWFEIPSAKDGRPELKDQMK